MALAQWLDELTALTAQNLPCLEVSETYRVLGLLGQGAFGHVVLALHQQRVRLAGGPSRCAGRVEVRHEGRWGTVCDDDWELLDAAVVCRELGCGTALSAPSGAWFGEGSGPIWLNGLRCRGTEERLELCRHRGWRKHVCAHEEDASAVCSAHPFQPVSTAEPSLPPTPWHGHVSTDGIPTRSFVTPPPGGMVVRLAGGPSRCAGRVEVWHEGRWGTVCDDDWGLPEGAVVCRELGCGTALEAPRGARFGPGTGPIWLDDMGCSGEETALGQCQAQPWGQSNCNHEEDASVVCTGGPMVRLTGAEGRCAGRLEVFHEGLWGTVCDDMWGLLDAAVVCRELGCGAPLSAPGAAFFGEGSGPIWLDNVRCRGNESALLQCLAAPWGITDCQHREDAAVVCADELRSLDVRPAEPTVPHQPPMKLPRIPPSAMPRKKTQARVPGSSKTAVASKPVAGTARKGLVQLRLAGGPGRCAGRVEVLHAGRWGTVCDDGWNLAAATVVCRELGCGAALEGPGRARYGPGTGPIWLDEVNCTGTEPALRRCPAEPWGRHNCNHHEDAAAVCEGQGDLLSARGTLLPTSSTLSTQHPAGQYPASTSLCTQQPAGRDAAGTTPSGQRPAGRDRVGITQGKGRRDPVSIIRITRLKAEQDPAGIIQSTKPKAGRDPGGTPRSKAGQDPAGTNRSKAGQDPAGTNRSKAGRDPAGSIRSKAGWDPAGTNRSKVGRDPAGSIRSKAGWDPAGTNRSKVGRDPVGTVRITRPKAGRDPVGVIRITRPKAGQNAAGAIQTPRSPSGLDLIGTKPKTGQDPVGAIQNTQHPAGRDPIDATQNIKPKAGKAPVGTNKSTSHPSGQDPVGTAQTQAGQDLAVAILITQHPSGQDPTGATQSKAGRDLVGTTTSTRPRAGQGSAHTMALPAGLGPAETEGIQPLPKWDVGAIIWSNQNLAELGPDNATQSKHPAAELGPDGTMRHALPEAVLDPEGTTQSTRPAAELGPDGTMRHALPEAVLDPEGTTQSTRPAAELGPDGTMRHALPEAVLGLDGTTQSTHPAAELDPDGTTWSTRPAAELGPDGTTWSTRPAAELGPGGTMRHALPEAELGLEGTTWSTRPAAELGPGGTTRHALPEAELGLDGTTQSMHPAAELDPDGTTWSTRPAAELGPDGTMQNTHFAAELGPDNITQSTRLSVILGPDDITKSTHPTVEPRQDGTMWSTHPSVVLHSDDIMQSTRPAVETGPDGTTQNTHPAAELGPDGTQWSRYPATEVGPEGTMQSTSPAAVLGPEGPALLAQEAVSPALPAAVVPAAGQARAQVGSGRCVSCITPELQDLLIVHRWQPGRAGRLCPPPPRGPCPVVTGPRASPMPPGAPSGSWAVITRCPLAMPWAGP
nr:PREDICTED: soluble scavenger receptor cysteine-rich domain-containing protein SSC5D [Struthio camelus australis]